jgi:hypothetical protein
MKIKHVFAALFLVFIPTLTFPQTNQTESMSFTTYFPSPNAVFNKMEVRAKLVVGNITDSHTSGITSINDLQKDQVFVTDSIILGWQSSAPSPAYEGQIFFNNTSSPKRLEVNNGTWQKIGP